MPISQNNKRIAKNTAMLYIRMLLSLFVGFYTSRIVLQTLGIVDYGIYNVVGGAVVLFSFLNSSMSSATARFLTYEMGVGNSGKLKRTFGTALTIHIAIAITIIILAESLGLWFVNSQLQIPTERMNAALWVFHLSVLSMAVSVTQVPYNACLIAHEKMDVYAYVELLNVFLRLAIVFILQIYGGDKLIVYAIMVFCVSLVIALLYRFYGYRSYEECRSKPCIDFTIAKPMLGFSGWDLYGNMSTVARTQGVNMLLNMFFGPALNAAGGIAAQVQGVVMGFANNVITAVKPQIIKSYAAADYDRMSVLIFNASKFTFLLLLLLSLPLMTEMHYVLNLWLGIVPDYAVCFCIFTLMFNFFATMSSVVVTAAHAVGKIKRPSFINGSLYLSVVPISYIAFRFGGNPEFSYIFNVIAVIIGLLSNAWTVAMYIPAFSFRKYFFDVFLRTLFVFAIATMIVVGVKSVFTEDSFWRLLVVTLISTCTLFILGYFVLMNKEMRSLVVNYVKRRVWKKD